MKRHQELGFNTAEVDPAQNLRKDINWATKKTLAVDKVSSGNLISFLKKSAVILAGKTTEGQEEVAVVLPQISTNNSERADEVRVASVAIQKEATHKAAQQRLISLEVAEEKLQRIDDGIEPRPKIIFQKTSGLMREKSKMARIAKEISTEREEKKTAGGNSETQASNVWQIPTKRVARRIKKRDIVMAATIPFLIGGCQKVVMTPAPTENRPAPTISVEPTELVPPAKETQIAPSPTQESMKDIILTSVEVMTEETKQAEPLLSDANFQEGIDNYVQETREIRGLTEENTTFELVVIKGMTTEGNEMLFPFATWTAQNQEGLTFVEMVGATEGVLVVITLERQEIEKDGTLYYALVLGDVGPIFAIPASEIDNENATISFSPSGQALEATESIGVPKVLFALKPEVQIEPTQTPEVKVSDITDEVRIFAPTTVIGERKLIPFGISEHYRFSSKEEELKRYLLSGMLLEKPYYDENGFVVFKLGIPDSSQDKFREFYFKKPISVSREGELRCGLTNSVRNIAYGGFDLLGGTGRFYSLEETIELYEKSIGRQITFVLEVGITEEDELKHLESILERFGSWDVPSKHAYELLKSQVDENYEVLTYFLNGSPTYEGKELGAQTVNAYVPWSSADWK